MMNKVAVKETAFFIIFFLRAVKNKKPTKNNKINKYILSFPVAILFAVLLSLHFLFCSAGTVIVAMMKGVYSVALYLFGFVVPLIIISLVAYILGAKNEEAIDRIRFLRLIGGIILVLIVIL